MKAFIGPKTEAQVKTFFESDRHAAILTGKEVAVFVKALENLAKTSRANQIVQTLNPEKATITIEQVRELKQSLSLKQATNRSRLLVVNHAETMTSEAQNSFLKLLEEPPAGLKFLILASYIGSLLPTIVSRASKIQIHSVSLNDALKFYEKAGSTTAEVKKAYAISNGEPGKMFGLLDDHESKYENAVAQAKLLISGSTYERLVQVENLAKNKQDLNFLLEAIDDILRAVSRAEATTPQGIQTITNKRKHILRSKEALQTNVNSKLLLTDALLAL